MKRVVCAFSFLIFSLTILAQYNYDYSYVSKPDGYLQKYLYSPLDKKIVKTNKISSVIEISGTCPMHSDSIKKKEQNWTYFFDTSGNLVSCRSLDHKGKLMWMYEIKYNSSNKVTDYSYRHKRSKKIYTEKYQYDNLNQVILKESFYDNKSSFKYICTYDSNRIKEMTVLKKGKPYLKWEYLYYPDGKNEETRRYDKKGKLKYTWTFACRDEGENMKKMKDSTLICRKDSHDLHGNRVLVYLQTNEKGKTTRTVYIYNPDTVLREGRGYDEKGRIAWKSIWDGKNKRSIEYIMFNKHKERIASRYLTTYDDDSEVTKYIHESYRRGKLHFITTSEYSYLKKGIPQKYITTSTKWKKHREIALMTYTYIP
jgi:hypothetical protein